MIKNKIENFLEMPCDNNSKFIIKLRPYYEQFFKELLQSFEIYVYTKASRSYADFILNNIQNKLGQYYGGRQLFPSSRIFSRDDTIVHTSKSLNRLFPPGLANNFMIILDDNAQMWQKFKQNYLPTKPFVYFLEGGPKDIQGINNDIEDNVQIINNNDHWLLCITEEIKKMACQFWNQVNQEPKNFNQKLRNIKVKKNYKLQSKIEDQIQQQQQSPENQKNEFQQRQIQLSLQDLIFQKEINIQSIYQENKKTILQGISLYFAISKQHSKEIQSKLELSKRIASQMGAKIFIEFKEVQFYDTQNTAIVTYDLKKIRSIILAQEKKFSIIHLNWVFDCEVFLLRIMFDAYNLLNYTTEQIENDQNRENITKNCYFARYLKYQQKNNQII